MIDKPLPVNAKNSTQAPEVIIRHFAHGNTATYYFLRDKIACNAPISEDIVNAFSPDKVLYLYEPHSADHPKYLNVECPSLITLTSSDITHNIEMGTTCRLGTLYMPPYTFDELLDIGRSIRNYNVNNTDSKLLYEYDDKQIQQHFERFGGKFDRVLRKSYRVVDYKHEYAKIIDWTILGSYTTIQSQWEYIKAHLSTKKGLKDKDSYMIELSPIRYQDDHGQWKYNFRQSIRYLASEEIERRALSCFLRHQHSWSNRNESARRLLLSLFKSKENLSHVLTTSKLLQRALARYCIPADPDSYDVNKPYECKKLIDRHAPYEEMKSNVLYCNIDHKTPKHSNANTSAFIDYYVKRNNEQLQL